MAATPLLAPEEYFARTDAFAARRAVVPVVAFWLAFVAVDALLGVTTEFATASVSRWLLHAAQSTALTLLAFAVVVAVLGRIITAENNLSGALVLAAWGLVPAILGRVAFVLVVFDPLGGSSSLLTVAVALVLALVACLWVGYCWRGGFQYAFDLRRSVATPATAIAVALCVLIVLLPLFV